MKKKTVLVIGILGILVAVSAMSLAMAQNQSRTKDIQDHKCTPEMMTDMSKNCPGQMMQSGNMMNATSGSSMMNNSGIAGNVEPGGADHCGGADSGMGSMMGSGATATKAMM